MKNTFRHTLAHWFEAYWVLIMACLFLLVISGGVLYAFAYSTLGVLAFSLAVTIAIIWLIVDFGAGKDKEVKE